MDITAESVVPTLLFNKRQRGGGVSNSNPSGTYDHLMSRAGFCLLIGRYGNEPDVRLASSCIVASFSARVAPEISCHLILLSNLGRCEYDKDDGDDDGGGDGGGEYDGGDKI